MMAKEQRIQNLLVSKDLSTFSILEQQAKLVEDSLTPVGTDSDEYKRWMSSTGQQGVGEVIYDDPDDDRDRAEFNKLSE
jgi:hypothetical protein